MECDSRIIFILYGDVISLPEIVEEVKASGKLAFVHMEVCYIFFKLLEKSGNPIENAIFIG